jgi:Ca2+-binding RTX toxin-like protein
VAEEKERDMGISGNGRFGRIVRHARIKGSTPGLAKPEILEVRRTPAASIMSLTSTGVLGYHAAAGDSNFLGVKLSDAGTEFVFEDVGAGVTINAAAVPGAIQLAPNKVAVPISPSVASLLVNLSDMNDTFVLNSDLEGRQITVNGGAGDDAIDLIQSTSLTVALGEAGNDYIWAGSGGSFILGGAGNDSLKGGAGTDSINGGLGDDTIDGGAGDDVLGELGPSAYVLPEIYGLLVYTGLDQPLDYVNQLVAFNRNDPSYVNVIGNNGIDPELYYGTGLDFDPSGNLYMTIQSNSNFFYSVDTATGAATLIGGSGLETGYRISDLSWDPVGNRMLATVDYRLNPPGPVPKPRLAEIDLTTGAVTFLATLDIDDNQSVALSVDSEGNYYVLGLFTQRWYKIDRNTFGVTPLAVLPFYPNNWQQGSTVDWSRNDVLYYAAFSEIDDTTYTNTFYTVDKATGNLTTVSIMGLNVNPNGSTQYADIAVNPLSDQGYSEPGNDVIYGGEGNDTIRSGAGNDTVDGGAGADVIDGQDGDDSILGGAGNDTLNGGEGNDIIRGQDGDDSIVGGNGADSLYGDAGSDHVDGGLGNDYIEGGADADLLCGDEGDDVIYGYSGNDTILGGEGNDFIDGGIGDDLIAGGLGNDSIYGNAGVDTILGGLGNDLIDGGDDADLLFGEEGDDTILGGNGDDLIYGGEGDDMLYGGSLATANTMHMPRNKSLASDGNDTILGGNGFDHVDGGNGNNLLDAGDDGIRETVLGGPGNDMMYSHKYTDRRNYDRAALDGGFNHDLCRGYLVQPSIPAVPANCEDFVAAMIPIEFYTGQWYVHGRVLVEYPRVERVPGNRNGFTPPFRGAQPRLGARSVVRPRAAARRIARS